MPDGLLAVGVGEAQGRLLEAGLTAATVQTALKSHALYRHASGQMLQRLNETLWSSSAGDQFSSLFYALVQPETGTVDYASAGAVDAAIVKKSAWKTITTDEPVLGGELETPWLSQTAALQAGDKLVVANEGVRRVLRRNGAESNFWQSLVDNDASAEELLEGAKGFLRGLDDSNRRRDLTLLIVKREG